MRPDSGGRSFTADPAVGVKRDMAGADTQHAIWVRESGCDVAPLHHLLSERLRAYRLSSILALAAFRPLYSPSSYLFRAGYRQAALGRAPNKCHISVGTNHGYSE